MSEHIEEVCQIISKNKRKQNKVLIEILKKLDNLKDWTCTMDNMFQTGPYDLYSLELAKLKHKERGVIIYYSLYALAVKELTEEEKTNLIYDLPVEMERRQDIKIMFYSFTPKGKYCLSWDYFSNEKWSSCEADTTTELIKNFFENKYLTHN